MFKGKGKLLPATLALAMLLPTAVFAANNLSSSGETLPDFSKKRAGFAERMQWVGEGADFAGKGFWHGETGEISAEMQAKMMEMKEGLGEKKANVKLMGKRGFKGGMKGELPEELRQKMQELQEKAAGGELTAEQAREEMHALMDEYRQEMMEQKLAALPEEVRQKVQDLQEKMQAIRENVTSGELTAEQAREEMQPLKEEFRQVMMEQKLASLPEEERQKLQEQWEKMQEVRDKVTSGELTPEQAREEIHSLMGEHGRFKLKQRKADQENQAQQTSF